MPYIINHIVIKSHFHQSPKMFFFLFSIPLLIIFLFFSSLSTPPSYLQFDVNQLMTSGNVSNRHSPIQKPTESPISIASNSSMGRVSGMGLEQSPVDRTKGFFPDESEPLLRCDSTSSKDSALSRNGSFITKGET